MGLCGRPRALQLLVSLDAILLCILFVHAAVPAFRGWSSGVFDNWLYDTAELLAVLLAAYGAVARRTARSGWVLLAGALASWTAADVYYGNAFGTSGAPGVTICDAGYLLFYVLLGSGLVLLVRSQGGLRAPLVWKVDVLGLALAIGAFALLWLDPVLVDRSGSTPAVIVNSVYTILDDLFLACLVTLMAVGGPKARRMWTPLAFAALTLIVADSLYLVETAHGTYVAGTPLDVLWPAGMGMLAVASLRGRTVGATRMAPETPPLPRTTILTAVTAFGSACAAMAHGHDSPALGAAVAALVVVLAREGTVGFRQAQELRRFAHHALNDDLTKLGNRRRFLAEAATVRSEQQGPATLVLLDLDRFKRHNDRYGHAAGDALLAAFAAELRQSFGTNVYRLGGDEFCVLTDQSPAEVAAHLEAPTSLVTTGVSVSHGAVILRDEATTVAEALELADRQLYERKVMQSSTGGRHGGVLVVSFAPQRQSQLVRIAAGLELGRVDAVQRASDVRAVPESSERSSYDVAIADVRDLETRSAVLCVEQLVHRAAATRLIAIGGRRNATEETARRLFAAGATGYLEVADAVTEDDLMLRTRALAFAELTVVGEAPSPCPPGTADSLPRLAGRPGARRSSFVFRT